MNKKKKIVLISVAAVTVVVLAVGILCGLTFFSPIPKNLEYGISTDKRVSIWHMPTDVKRYIFKNDRGVLPFLMSAPQNIEQGKEYPLVIYLHGRGDWGQDNVRQFVTPAPTLHNGIKKYAEPCYEIYPQSAKGEYWNSSWHTDEPAKYALLVNELLDYAVFNDKLYPIDTNRIYIVGQSMGGYGVTYILQLYPERYAAGVVIAAGVSWLHEGLDEQQKLAKIPMWIAQSKDDKINEYALFEGFVGGLELGGGGNYVTDIYEDKGHAVAKTVFKKPEFFAWLFGQIRGQHD